MANEAGPDHLDRGAMGDKAFGHGIHCGESKEGEGHEHDAVAGRMGGNGGRVGQGRLGAKFAATLLRRVPGDKASRGIWFCGLCGILLRKKVK